MTQLLAVPGQSIRRQPSAEPLDAAGRPVDRPPALPDHCQYKGFTPYVGCLALYRLAGRNGLLVLLLALAGVMLWLPLPPRSSLKLLWFLLTGFTGAVRFALCDLFLGLQNKPWYSLIRVPVFGAGNSGVQLAAALRHAGTHNV